MLEYRAKNSLCQCPVIDSLEYVSSVDYFIIVVYMSSLCNNQWELRTSEYYHETLITVPA